MKTFISFILVLLMSIIIVGCSSEVSSQPVSYEHEDKGRSQVLEILENRSYYRYVPSVYTANIVVDPIETKSDSTIDNGKLEILETLYGYWLTSIVLENIGVEVIFVFQKGGAFFTGVALNGDRIGALEYGIYKFELYELYEWRLSFLPDGVTEWKVATYYISHFAYLNNVFRKIDELPKWMR